VGIKKRDEKGRQGGALLIQDFGSDTDQASPEVPKPGLK
jgi:hypothetical protein